MTAEPPAEPAAALQPVDDVTDTDRMQASQKNLDKM